MIRHFPHAAPPPPPPNPKQLRKFNEAEALLRQALSESPSDAPALVLLGRVRATAGGHLDEAMGFYRRALEASPDHAPAHHALAKVFAFQQRCVFYCISFIVFLWVFLIACGNPSCLCRVGGSGDGGLGSVF